MNIEKVYNNLYLQSVERWSLIIEKIYSKFTECGKMMIEHWESLQQILQSVERWSLNFEKIYNKFSECGKMVRGQNIQTMISIVCVFN